MRTTAACLYFHEKKDNKEGMFTYSSLSRLRNAFLRKALSRLRNAFLRKALSRLRNAFLRKGHFVS
jgi:hypothetical protein